MFGMLFLSVYYFQTKKAFQRNLRVIDKLFYNVSLNSHIQHEHIALNLADCKAAKGFCPFTDATEAVAMARVLFSGFRYATLHDNLSVEAISEAE